LEIIECGNEVRVYGVTDFCLEHIFECGQAFRWNRSQKGYTGIAAGKVINVDYMEEDQVLILKGCTTDEFNEFWKHYFDLTRDYSQIKMDLSSNDQIMEEAVRYGWGIRILNQDPWETLISFIISANNNITRIKGIIEKLSRKFGKQISGEGNEGSPCYSFPSPLSLALADEEDLKACGCGYRGKYIKHTAGMVVNGLIDIYGLKNLSYEEAHRELVKCMGVGDKVADCILLFSMEKAEAFPVDVWVKRIMESLYIGHTIPKGKIKTYAKKLFGPYAGLAQQYLFYYAREKKIGKKE
jgi:N-glycosylase/DNA lyase